MCWYGGALHRRRRRRSGARVRDRFCRPGSQAAGPAFVHSSRAEYYLADIYQLARRVCRPLVCSPSAAGPVHGRTDATRFYFSIAVHGSRAHGSRLICVGRARLTAAHLDKYCYPTNI